MVLENYVFWNITANFHNEQIDKSVFPFGYDGVRSVLKFRNQNQSGGKI